MSTPPGPALRWVLPALGVLAGTAPSCSSPRCGRRRAWPGWRCWPGAAAAGVGVAPCRGPARWLLAWPWPCWPSPPPAAAPPGGWPKALAPALEGQDLVQVTGRVDQPAAAQHAGRHTLRAGRWRKPRLGAHAVQVPPRLSLGWYRGWTRTRCWAARRRAARRPALAACRCACAAAWQPFNPHGFDLELWLFEQGIGASGYVRSRRRRQRLAAGRRRRGGATLQAPAQDIATPSTRAWPTRRGRRAGGAGGGRPGRPSTGPTGTSFRNTGVAHLMAISGLHVTMFAWLAGVPLGGCGACSPRGDAGGACPAGRALGRACAGRAGLRAAGRLGRAGAAHGGHAGRGGAAAQPGLRWPCSLVLLAAGAGVGDGDPWALLQPGFWLSFVAVGLLVASEPVPVAPAPRRLATGGPAAARCAGLRTQGVATVGPGAADAGVLPAGVAGGLRGQPGGHSAGHAADHAAGLAGRAAAAAVGGGSGRWCRACGLLGLMAAWPWAVWTPRRAALGQAAALLGGRAGRDALPWRLRCWRCR
jgi:competence protein ComEC